MSLDTYAWITDINPVKSYVEFEESQDEEVMEELVNACYKDIEARCDRQFMSRSYTAILDGNGRTYLPMPYYPITAVTSLYTGRTALTDGVEITSDYYEWDANNQEDPFLYLLDGYTFPEGFRNVKITFTAGYSTIPADLRELLLAYVAFLWRKRDVLGKEVIERAFEGVVERFATEFWTKTRLAVVRRYRRY